MTHTLDLSDLTLFRIECLAAVAELEQQSPEVCGLDILELLGERFNEDINHGRLYPNLDWLADHGLLAKGQIDDRTNTYRLTGRGAARLESLGSRYSSLAPRNSESVGEMVG